MRTILPLALFFCLALLFYPTLRDVAEICWTYEDYSHGLLLPLISAYLLWLRRADIAARAQAAAEETAHISRTGGALFVCGLLVFFVGQAGDSFYASWVAMFPTLIGALLLVFGPKITGTVAGPLLLNFMAKPIPDSLLPKLLNPFQTFAALVSARVLELLHVPVYTMGNVIEIPGMRLLVEQACSGMRSLISLLTVAFIVLCLMNFNRLGQITIIAAAVATAVLLNIVRVALTGILAHFVDPVTATGFFHTFAGMLVFIVGLFILGFLGRLLERQPGDNKQ